MKIGHTIPLLISAVVPGCGHIAAGRPARGLLLFFLFGFAIDGFLYSQAQSILPPDRTPLPPAAIHNIAIAAGAALWLLAIADTAAIVRRQRRIESRAAEATDLIRQALVASLRKDWSAAAHALHAALRIDPHDPDALFHLGVVYAAAGHRRKARRALQRCVRCDHDGKWDSQAAEQLDALDAAPPPGEPAPANAAKDNQGETRA